MIAIAGGKGGCGKTTTALGVATALAGRGYEPLVVDGDCDMPDVHHRAGLDRAGGIDALAEGESLACAVEETAAVPGVRLLTGGRRDALDTALRRVRAWDGPVLVDCAAGTSEASLRPLRRADRALVVSTTQPQCLEDTAVTRDVVRRLPTALVGVVVRLTPQARDGTVPENWSVCARLPAVDTPLDNPQVTREYHAVSRRLVSDRARVRRHSPRALSQRTSSERNI